MASTKTAHRNIARQGEDLFDWISAVAVLDVYERGMAVRQGILEQGLQRTRYALNERSKGNADRILKTLADFIPGCGYAITSEELFARYQESVGKQLRA